MTPKEKAQQLRDKFYFETTISELGEAQDCALITVKEIIKEIKFDIYLTEYWQEVKKELIEL
jgi:hypothetical protein